MTRYQKILFIIFLIVWVWAAYYPTDPKEWLLENCLVFLLVGMIFIMARHFTFSNTSLTLITIFLVFHLAGSHYAYTQVPFGYVLQDWLGETRNMYDRFMHLLFGLMFTYPCFELTERIMKTKRFASYYMAFNMILAFSAIYEVLEWLAVRHIDVNASMYFVGAQGDNWDTPKDMALASVGAIMVLICTLLIRRYRNLQIKKQEMAK